MADKATDRSEDPGPSIKDPDLYETLLTQGHSKESAARISNAKANPNMDPSTKGGEQPPYEQWTKNELYERAKELGIDGRSEMTKSQLIDALRH